MWKKIMVGKNIDWQPYELSHCVSLHSICMRAKDGFSMNFMPTRGSEGRSRRAEQHERLFWTVTW